MFLIRVCLPFTPKRCLRWKWIFLQTLFRVDEFENGGWVFCVDGENELFENMDVTTVMCACSTVYLASLGSEEVV